MITHPFLTKEPLELKFLEMSPKKISSDKIDYKMERGEKSESKI
jgi:hypothetical protein